MSDNENPKFTMVCSLERQVIHRQGIPFTASVMHDEYNEAPWSWEDTHGPVVEDVTRAKEPGEMLLKRVGERKTFYVYDEACRIALRDGWGPSHPGESRKQTAARCARMDYERLRAWCNDLWHYVGVTVEVFGPDTGDIFTDPPVIAHNSCWGIESDDEGYQLRVANDMLDQFDMEQVVSDYVKASLHGVSS